MYTRAGFNLDLKSGLFYNQVGSYSMGTHPKWAAIAASDQLRPELSLDEAT